MNEYLTTRRSRLDEISELKDGWLDGQGSSIREENIAKAHKLIEQMDSINPYLLQGTRIYPMEKGGVSIEIDHNDELIFVEIEDSRMEVYSILMDEESTYSSERKAAEKIQEYWLKSQ